jgi:lipopolysaccharide transport system ATP-binding protein
MRELAVQAHDIRKQYSLGQRFHYRTLRDAFSERLLFSPRRVFDSGQDAREVKRQSRETFWALDGVTFDVRAGEVLGIIGRNGAGKTTLLKILSRITEPTSGYAEIRGRVGSLLEVGTGFHPELTGRENVLLNGAILGMRKTEIRSNMDEIIEFAGISRFIDTPVKFYSSGMYLRLAFAVAAHLQTEVLLVDETLAVGDAEFQRKCLDKMENLAQQGRTVVFVSHNLLAIQDLCQEVMWIDAGKIVEKGPTDQVVADYLHKNLQPAGDRAWDDCSLAPGTTSVRLHRAGIRSRDQFDSDVLTVRTSFDIEYEYRVLKSAPSVYACINVYNEQGVLLFNSGPASRPEWRTEPARPGLYREKCRIPGDLLNDGLHRVDLTLFEADEVYHHEELLVFDVQDTVGVRDHWYGKWEGAMRPILEWGGERLDVGDNVFTVESSGAGRR